MNSLKRFTISFLVALFVSSVLYYFLASHTRDTEKTFYLQKDTLDYHISEKQNDKQSISTDSIISASIAVFVLVFGYYLTRKNEQKKHYNHLKTVENYLYILFDEIIDTTKFRIESFENLLSQLETKKQQDIKMTYVADYGLEFLKDIKWDDYFSVFTSLKKSYGDNDSKEQVYQNINKNISSINAINVIWKDSYKELLNRQSEYEKRWNLSISEVGKRIDKFATWMHSNNYHKGTDKFVDELDDIIGNAQKNPDYKDIYISMKVLVNPMLSLIKNNLGNPIGTDFLEHILNCIYAFENYDKNREAFAEQFRTYIRILKKNIEKLKENIKKHKSFKDDRPSFFKFWKF